LAELDPGPGDAIDRIQEDREREARHLSTAELERRSALAAGSPPPLPTSAAAYLCNPYVAELAKRRAGGHCQLCGAPAPFLAKGGRPFLEVHHIHWLSRGGADTRHNTVALCPNCHRKMHVLDLELDRQRLTMLLQEPTSVEPAQPVHATDVTDQAIEDFIEAMRAEAQAQALPPVGGGGADSNNGGGV
jgi:5-methylcytosine-specific restriction protein A